ncbi:hypothetical protein Mzhil_1054 [Methanosalsum zhilinae DSM 4017]|uniref:Uncharacterized protein n=1 Tax=Methanosalsum zhilinae (strain DSM 4017 / NBRC 107636 / OCM 62 / WeN5) TaxID=679901 RepID=F7XLY3_METZD|nr:hypothetical protein [Methanosalsum zhilinae]AEH60911.1 hypothetical protein Mzhil_1054 [Methanosalsum zhilinae DSM 4017]
MDINIRTILAGIGGLTGIGAVISFLQTDLFSSPLTTTIALIAVGTLILAITYRTADRAIKNVGVVLCSFSVIASLLYGVTSLTTGALMITLTLAILSAGFLFAAYISQTDRNILTQRNLTVLSIIFMSLFVLTATVDALMGEPVYELELKDTITEVEPTNIRSTYIVGTVTITNPSYLPLHAERQSYQACLTGLDLGDIEDAEQIKEALRDITLRSEPVPDPIFTSAEADLIFVPGFAVRLEEAGISITDIPIVGSTQCPQATQEPQLTIIIP